MNELKIGDMYNIKFKDKWSLTPKCNIVVIGMTKLSQSHNYSDFDIRGKYFIPNGITRLSEYMEYVNESVDIYVCNEIKDIDDIKFDDKSILIPSSIIDYKGSLHYSEIENVTLTISGIIEKFKSAYDKGTYIRDIKNECSRLLESCSKIGGTPIIIDLLFEKHLMVDSNFELFDSARNIGFEKANKARISNKMKMESDWNGLFVKSRELTKKIAENDLKTQELSTELASLDVLRTEVNNRNIVLNNCTTVMTNMLSKVRNGEIAPQEVPTFNELYKSVEDELIQTGVITGSDRDE